MAGIGILTTFSVIVYSIVFLGAVSGKGGRMLLIRSSIIPKTFRSEALLDDTSDLYRSVF